MLDQVFDTPVGQVQVLASVRTNGSELLVDDVIIFGNNGGVLVNNVGASAFFAVRNIAARYAAKEGFTTMRIAAHRTLTSSSRTPGHSIDRVVYLEKFK